MEPLNKVRIEIYGTKFVITSSESPDYVKGLARELDGKIRTFMKDNESASLTDAYLITLLGYADQYRKSEDNADHIRGQLTEYLEDAARARIEADEYKREIDKLKREINLLRQTRRDDLR